jgi:hypothetical protein
MSPHPRIKANEPLLITPNCVSTLLISCPAPSPSVVATLLRRPFVLLLFTGHPYCPYCSNIRAISYFIPDFATYLFSLSKIFSFSNEFFVLKALLVSIAFYSGFVTLERIFMRTIILVLLTIQRILSFSDKVIYLFFNIIQYYHVISKYERLIRFI